MILEECVFGVVFLLAEERISSKISALRRLEEPPISKQPSINLCIVPKEVGLQPSPGSTDTLLFLSKAEEL